MKSIFVSFVFIFGAIVSLFATHNRAGQITYRHISGYSFEITVHTYTKISSFIDRTWLPIYWGDDTPRDSIQRSQGIIFANRDTEENIYIKVHTYPGPGLYKICVSDPNRNGGVLNIVNSVQVQFSIQTVLIISPVIALNNSVVLTNIPIQDACFQQPWIYNPGAVDLDGDSIAYSLVTPQGVDCMELSPGEYSLPDRIPLNQFPNPNNQISIDPQTGTVTWASPQLLGEYNIAILIKEYRNGIFIGSVLSDMQILVKVCDNLPPAINAVPDKCVTAGTGLSFPVTASDPDGGVVILSGFGAPFNVPSSPAPPLSQSGLLSPVTAIFNWNTNCSHVRLQPYQVTFQATDYDPEVNLVDITTMNINVVAPAPQNLLAVPVGSSIALSWSPTICNNALGYRLYRRIDPFGFIPDECETGVPGYTGYTLIAQIPGVNNVTYPDEDEIVFGRQNCYLVIAYFADGSESYAGNEACAEILFEIPIIKKNSIGITGINGVDTVAWRAPAKLDPEVFPGPYKFRLLRGEGYGATTELVLETEENADIEALPTSFISTGLNTEASAHTYRVELFSGGTFASRSNRASSLFLAPIPDDNQINLTWEKQAPWANFRYDIYQQAQGETEFILIGNTTEASYLNTGLVNNLSYCYYIVSYGSYFSVLESDTLINFSQQACAQPYDRTPPCPPVLTANDDCEELTVDLNWTNPNIACDETDDTMMYHIYFSPTEDGEFELIQEVNGAEITEFFLELDNSIAGCYAVTALDSLSLWPNGELVRNESEFSNIVCFDNCPVYSLPNVFTPNGDGQNDILLAFPYRAVEYVEFTLYNRWGSVVFETTDPDINWDGRNKETGELVTSSTYFYVCNVFTIRLEGLVPITLTGNITVFSSEGKRLD